MSYAQLEEIGKKLVPFRDVLYKQNWRATVNFQKMPAIGEFAQLEVRAVDFTGSVNVEIDGYCYHGKQGIACRSFLFRFVPLAERGKEQIVVFTFDDAEGFNMDSERNLRDHIEPVIVEAFDALVVKLRQEANCLEGDELPKYPCVVLAQQILRQSKELQKSVLLNNTISMHSVIKNVADGLRDPDIAEDREAMWTLCINETPWNSGPTAIVCNLFGKYIDCLRAIVCIKQVHHLMFALPRGTTLREHIYLLPVITAYSKVPVPS